MLIFFLEFVFKVASKLLMRYENQSVKFRYRFITNNTLCIFLKITFSKSHCRRVQPSQPNGLLSPEVSVLKWIINFRVHTGFEWNKYNQTHYDMDNPPPKIVQGYKFNIFYPDLIDKNATPEYILVICFL